MPTLTRRVLDHHSLSTGDAMDAADALDLGEHQTLELVLTVHSAGTGTSIALVVQHAPFNESGAYLDFPTAVRFDLSTTGTTWSQVDRFTRFVSWSVDGNLDTAAEVTLDVVAKG